ncbi:MAG: DUF2807 domain-containing protein [Bacteroidales bacterium]|nr:DUF2807 domain-containing protein [Bacteroidales bacterium]
MKRVIFPVSAMLVMLLGSSFIFADRAAEDVRKLDSFDGIGISIPADVFYTRGNTHEIRIEGADKDVRDLITKVKDGFLQVKYDDWKMKRSKLTIYIISEDLEAVKISGSAHFMAEKPISSEEMDLAMSGSGRITFGMLEAEEIDVKISGSGNVVLEKGEAEELDVKISGSGDCLAEKFVVSECSVIISGSGGCKITANDEIDVTISGSGSVRYHGDPRVNSISSGSGKVVAF